MNKKVFDKKIAACMTSLRRQHGSEIYLTLKQDCAYISSRRI